MKFEHTYETDNILEGHTYSIHHIKPATFSSKNNLVALQLHYGSRSLKMQMSNS